MRDYSKISTSLWRSRKFRSLTSDRARLFYLYVHTCPHVNSAGCFPLPIGYAEADLGWPRKEIAKAIDSLCEANLIAFDRAEEVVRIVDFLKHDQPTNEKHARGVVKAALSVPDCGEKLRALRELAQNPHTSNVVELHEAIESLSKAYRNPEPEPEPYPEPEPDNPPVDVVTSTAPHGGDSEGDSEFDEWWEQVPRKIGKGQARKAYRAARRKVDKQTLLAGIQRYAASVMGQEKRFICHPATWLNGERWTDEPEQPSNAGAESRALAAEMGDWR